jgi:hypothetical protein
MLGDIISENVCCIWASPDTGVAWRPKKLSQAMMHRTCIRKVLVLNFSWNTGYPNILVVFLSSPGKCQDDSTTRQWLSPSTTFPIRYSLSIPWNTGAQIQSSFPNVNVNTSKSFMSVEFSLPSLESTGAVKYFQTQHQGTVSGQLNGPPLYPWDKCPRYPSSR